MKMKHYVISLLVGLSIGAAVLFSQNRINLIDQIKQTISGTAPIAVTLTDTAFTISCNNCGADSPDPNAFGGMVGGSVGVATSTTFAIPSGITNGTFQDVPAAVSGYVRNLAMYVTATTPNGSTVRIAHDPNSGFGNNNPSRGQSFSVFSGQAQGVYSDAIGFARVNTGDFYEVRIFNDSATNSSVWGAWATEFVPDGTASLLFGLRQASVTASTTTYFGIVGNGVVNATETSVGVPVPFTMTLSKFCVTTSSGQPASGTLVLTVRDSAAPTALVLTIVAGAPAGMYCNLVDTASLTGATDWMALQVVNNATAASASIRFWSIGHAAATGTKWAVCEAIGSAFAAGTRYITLLEGGDSTVEVNETMPFPITAATTGDFYVYVGTAGGGGTTTDFTLRKNLAGSALTASVAAGVTGVVTGTGSPGLVKGDTISMQLVQTGAGGALIGGTCFSIVEP